jgi:hypothetical protein
MTWPSRDPNVPHPGKVFYAGEWRTPIAVAWKNMNKRRGYRRVAEARDNVRIAELPDEAEARFGSNFRAFLEGLDLDLTD